MSMSKCPHCDYLHICHQVDDKFECCGFPMQYQEIFGIRRYECYYRPHHPVTYVNLATNQVIIDKSLPYQQQE